MKLSKVQQIMVERMQDGKWHSEYNLACRLSTMTVLVNKGIVEPHPKNGGWLSKWRLIERGSNNAKMS